MKRPEKSVLRCQVVQDSEIHGKQAFINNKVLKNLGLLNLRSTMLKKINRHSKLGTSNALRDRRVRLSVPTAIQFYDLQDRLGFDQPSKAVDWLIQVAADAIAELPLPSLAASAWTLSAVASSASLPSLQDEKDLLENNCCPMHQKPCVP
ncbi:hypothetical protein MRB53_002051 [Persea americana]|uniref:Uncharacterized protein n=1 Tax=Persea americana TaxID=3435 RepID=A0ACC2MTR1_PERAE|nr:hypothetical protein MRB53_002051 [Persea americana]